MQKILTATLGGYEASLVEIETDVSNGLPATIIVGLPDTMVQESKERVRSALRHTSFQYPPTRVSINLAPSNLPKIGSHFDLGIALSILLADGLLEFDSKSKLFIGELALDGAVRPGVGILSMVIAAKKAGLAEVYVPQDNIQEAGLVDDIKVYGVNDLNNLIEHLTGRVELSSALNLGWRFENNSTAVDFADIVGQVQAKRAIEIAAAGAHNIRMVGAPGSGKTMLAKALLGILPPPTKTELLEIVNIHSLAGEYNKATYGRPFRSPHHTASSIALIGGGARPKPGEVSLAHRGVLFLDELPEFPRQALEVLRQPLEDGRVVISRASQSVVFPARFMLVAAQNPCQCGNYQDPNLECSCHPAEVQKYNKKLSGPLLDRIDIHVQVPRMTYKEFTGKASSANSFLIKQRITKARQVQSARLGEGRTNSEMHARQIKKHCALSKSSHQLLSQAADQYMLSGRSINKILKLTRTIADLEGAKFITDKHLAEALQYKM